MPSSISNFRACPKSALLPLHCVKNGSKILMYWRVHSGFFTIFALLISKISTLGTGPRKKMNRDWGICYALAISLFLLIVAVWEGTAIHQKGAQSTAIDNANLWIQAREKAKLVGKHSTIVIGSSRAQLGTHLKTIEAATKHRVTQLAIDGSVFFYVLQDLADDPSINGTVIVDASLTDFFSRAASVDKSREWLALYHGPHQKNQFYYQRSEGVLDFLLSDYLRARTMGIKPYRHGWPFWDQKAVHNDYLRTLPNREKQADFTKANLHELSLNQIKMAEMLKKEYGGQSWQFLNRVQEAARLVKKIQARGGRVIFVHYPVSDEIYAFEEQLYPKMVYWDGVLKKNIGTETIHFKDYLALSDFEFPDGTHLDYRDTERFTQCLLEVISSLN